MRKRDKACGFGYPCALDARKGFIDITKYAETVRLGGDRFGARIANMAIALASGILWGILSLLMLAHRTRKGVQDSGFHLTVMIDHGGARG